MVDISAAYSEIKEEEKKQTWMRGIWRRKCSPRDLIRFCPSP